MAVDYNENDFFELDEYIDDASMSLTKDILNHKVTLGGIPSDFAKIKLVVTDVTALEDFDVSNDNNLYSVEYIFTCNSGCNLVVGQGGWDNSLPTANSGSISIFSEQNFEVCAGKTFCFDYAVNGPAYVYISINDDRFTNTVFQAGASTDGQFCWQPTLQDLGMNTFLITATDNHPSQALTKNRIINVEVETYNTGCLCAGQFADETVNLSSNIRSGDYVALKNLNSDALVFSSTNVQFKAGKSITLNSGFYAPVSTNFGALITNCQQPDVPVDELGTP